jgi:hypothetical protein
MTFPKEPHYARSNFVSRLQRNRNALLSQTGDLASRPIVYVNGDVYMNHSTPIVIDTTVADCGLLCYDDNAKDRKWLGIQSIDPRVVCPTHVRWSKSAKAHLRVSRPTLQKRWSASTRRQPISTHLPSQEKRRKSRLKPSRSLAGG